MGNTNLSKLKGTGGWYPCIMEPNFCYNGIVKTRKGFLASDNMINIAKGKNEYFQPVSL